MGDPEPSISISSDALKEFDKSCFWLLVFAIHVFVIVGIILNNCFDQKGNNAREISNDASLRMSPKHKLGGNVTTLKNQMIFATLACLNKLTAIIIINVLHHE